MCRECMGNGALAEACSERRSDFVREQFLFSGLSEDQLEAACFPLVVDHFGSDHWLFFQGDRAERLFLVEAGEVALVRNSEDGEEVIVAIVGPGETFAEESLLSDPAVHVIGCRSLTPCSLISFDVGRLARLLDEPAFARKLMTTLHRRNQILIDEIEHQALRSATDRLLGFLRREAGNGGRSGRVSLSYPKRTLASRLSIKPETLSRILARLRDCSMLEVDGNDIVLVESSALRDTGGCEDCARRFWGCPGYVAPRQAAAATRA